MCSKSEMDQMALKMMDKVFKPGQDPLQVIAVYNEWCKTYEETMGDGRFNGPIIAAEHVAEMIPEDRRQHVRILDIAAAGTGAVGRELHKKGFTNIDALDPSEGMLNILRDKGVYKITYQEFISQNPTTIPQDTYDVVVTCGGMGESHLPVQGINEFIRVVKPGGLVIILMLMKRLLEVEAYKDKLEPHMDHLEQQGLWHKKGRKVVPNFTFGDDGIVFIYRVAN
ncbi:methyltransferase-like protein 27 [Procambarus clarkii]|uniref:methyltransferase-like protein 27 n=1 Tax=Procambarus clarkii TaxID=6728 RepID=UPI0037435AA2